MGANEDIPQDCDVLVIAGAKMHLSQKEEGIINTFMEQGGDVLFLIEHVLITTPDKPLTKEQILLNPSLNNLNVR